MAAEGKFNDSVPFMSDNVKNELNNLDTMMNAINEEDSDKPLKSILKRSFDDENDMETNKIHKNNSGARKRKKVKTISAAPKTALMKLNEAMPGLSYTIECIGGPPHQPTFKASVIVEKQTYVGTGKSKQLAKLAAADSALR